MMYRVVKHDQEMMRKINKGNILNLIREKKPVSRSELAKITGMSPTSVGRIVTELIELGLIKETEPASSHMVGRKALLLDTEPNSVYTICIQLDEDVSRIGIVDLKQKHLPKILMDQPEVPGEWYLFISGQV